MANIKRACCTLFERLIPQITNNNNQYFSFEKSGLSLSGLMTRLIMIMLIALAGLGLAACASFSLDKDRAEEHRKQELCQEIDTKDLPHCAGTLEPESE